MSSDYSKHPAGDIFSPLSCLRRRLETRVSSDVVFASTSTRMPNLRVWGKRYRSPLIGWRLLSILRL